MHEILLIGGGGHCISCIDVIEKEKKYKIAGIVDNTLQTNNTQEVLGYPILGTDEDLEKLRRYFSHALVTIGQIISPTPRIQLYKNLKNLDFVLPTIISPLAYIAKNVTISEGSIVMHHALINTSSKIGKMCIINTKALIEHGCTIQDFCHISTAAVLNGDCIVEEQSFIGSNMGIKHGQTIKKKSIIFKDIFK